MRWISWAVIMCFGGGLTHAWAACVVSGPDTFECEGITYRALDEQGVYFVDWDRHQQEHPGVPLPERRRPLEKRLGRTTSMEPVVVALTDYVDCTRTDHNFSDANIVPSSVQTVNGTTFNTNPHPNRPSRLMDISGRTFRVTAAPEDGFACTYFSYDLATGGTAGVAHLLMAESSNDQERYTSLIVHHPDHPLASNPGAHMPAWSDYGWAPPYAGEPTYNPWGDPWWAVNGERTQQGPVFAPDVGLTTYTGRDLPIDHQPFNITMLFHPKSSVARVVVSSLGCNLKPGDSDGGAVARIWSFRFVDRMSDRYPRLTPPADDSHKQRLIGIYMTHPWYLYAHYGTPVRTLAQRQEALRRALEHLKFCGMNYLAFSAINGADRSEKAWYAGSSAFAWCSAGDLLEELPPIAHDEKVALVPVVTSLQATPSNRISVPDEAYQVNSNGRHTRAFGNPTLDPLHPDVQALTLKLLGEISSRVAASSAVQGIGLRVNGKLGTCYTADQDGHRGARTSGYSRWNLEQFKQATGSDVPVRPPDVAYDWLVARPAEWERWIDYRCRKTRDFWLACRDFIRTVRPDWVLYLQCDLPSEVPGTNIEWPDGETPYNLLRHHGYDPHLFAEETGIVITRGMMVAMERFYSGSRWAAPFGTNHDSYRLFHFAPGLAEFYRTAQGRACDFYQTYWEEPRHPYFEYGSTGDPAGYMRTTTPAAVGRAFFAPAIMSIRRQDPDTMTWLGWNRPTLGYENALRQFAQAFRALPAVPAVPFAGAVSPGLPEEIVVRWHADRLAVIHDSPTPRMVKLEFRPPRPAGEQVVDVATGHVLMAADAANRTSISLFAEAYSLTTLRFGSGGPPASPEDQREHPGHAGSGEERAD